MFFSGKRYVRRRRKSRPKALRNSQKKLVRLPARERRVQEELKRRLVRIPETIEGRPVVFVRRNHQHKTEVFFVCQWCSRPRKDGGTGRKTVHRHGVPNRDGKPTHRLSHCPCSVAIATNRNTWGYFLVCLDDIEDGIRRKFENCTPAGRAAT